MSCGKCGKCSGRSGLCPVSFGMALGLTSGLAILLWSFWVMYNGVPPMMVGKMPEMTYMGAFMHAFTGLWKGFLSGFFVALFYDFFSCYCKAMCCKKSDASCECNCSDKSAGGK